jgi:hypothetical protein
MSATSSKTVGCFAVVENALAAARHGSSPYSNAKSSSGIGSTSVMVGAANVSSIAVPGVSNHDERRCPTLGRGPGRGDPTAPLLEDTRRAWTSAGLFEEADRVVRSEQAAAIPVLTEHHEAVRALARYLEDLAVAARIDHDRALGPDPTASQSRVLLCVVGQARGSCRWRIKCHHVLAERNLLRCLSGHRHWLLDGHRLLDRHRFRQRHRLCRSNGRHPAGEDGACVDHRRGTSGGAAGLGGSRCGGCDNACLYRWKRLSHGRGARSWRD